MIARREFITLLGVADCGAGAAGRQSLAHRYANAAAKSLAGMQLDQWNRAIGPRCRRCPKPIS
jgi:hypothetical protein